MSVQAVRNSAKLVDWRDRGTRRLALAIAASFLLHVAVMSLRFVPPEPLQITPIDTPLDVVLLNAANQVRPTNPDVAAQASMLGGGDHDRGRAQSPLPAEARVEDGDALVEQRARIRELERLQRDLMVRAGADDGVPAPEAVPPPVDRPDAAESEESDESRAVIARLQAEIARRVQDYSKRPRRLTFGVNAVGVSYARYVDDWSSRIEKMGTDRYPAEARGRQYDSMVVLVEIDKDGNVVKVDLKKPSQYPALNAAVRRIVYAGAPYERFTPEMMRDGDILQIVRTWRFTHGSLETSTP